MERDRPRSCSAGLGLRIVGATLPPFTWVLDWEKGLNLGPPEPNAVASGDGVSMALGPNVATRRRPWVVSSAKLSWNTLGCCMTRQCSTSKASAAHFAQDLSLK